MEEALSFFRAFEWWIYAILGLGGLYYLRKFILAWQELRAASFGLERESAQARLNQSASILVLVLVLAVTEFVLVSFIAPTVPGATPLFTPTLSLLTTPTTTLSPETPPPAGTATGGPGLAVLTTNTPLGGTGCIEGQIMITSPRNGDEIKGVVEVIGSADIPSFGFYKFEMKRPDENIWATLQAGNEVKIAAKLGDWDTRRLPPGDYQLGLVVVDNQGRASPPCIVQVRVTLPPAETTSP
jgi:hypothetical protein